MRVNVSARFCALLLVVLLVIGAASGCRERPIDHAPAKKREIKVDAPGAEVTVEGANAAAPAAGVDVTTGPGGVKVEVDAPAIRERLRERREESSQPVP